MEHVKQGYEWKVFRITPKLCVWRWGGREVAFTATPWETFDDCSEGDDPRYAFQPRGQGYDTEDEALLNPEPHEHYVQASWFPPGIKEEQT